MEDIDKETEDALVGLIQQGLVGVAFLETNQHINTEDLKEEALRNLLKDPNVGVIYSGNLQ